MRKRQSALFIIAALVSGMLFFAPGNLYAQTGPDPYAGLTDAELQQRITFIQNRLDKTEKWAQAWRYGWIGLYSSLSIVQGGLTFADDDIHWKEDMIVGSITAFVGLCGKLIFSFEPAVAPAKLRFMPEATSMEKREKLKEAERLFRICAEEEYDGWAWLTHLLNFSVNFTAGMVVWLAFDRPLTDGLTTFATGYAISLLDIFTQPTNAVRDRKEYLKKFGHGNKDAAAEEEGEFFFALSPLGFSAGIRF
ncbi:MAG TPA: hypothetical protein PK926_13695 [Spirochaetota bacterium]|mgnify:CR=1 FL=1|nr:hypothetical protein [Spirochaetota bacterium]HPI91368.1 hypothetical protein [Spirochaetota bacterium]HPR49638.1 hypothetical protein [Spirochaetota bacterium]